MSSKILETVDVNAPVSVSWQLWSDVTRWPTFLRHVERVDRIDEKRFTWWLSLPGADKYFAAELTEAVAEERIAWKTTAGVHHTGIVVFQQLSDTTSRVTLHIDYDPEGFIEHLGALTNLDKVLANYDLGQFQHMAEEVAAAAR
ncbi:SRPBCC family protein [Streptomyces sp. NPDC054861]